MSNMMSLN